MNSSTLPGETGSRAVEDLAHRHPALVSTARARLGGQGRRLHPARRRSPCRSPSQGAGGDDGGRASGEASQTGAVAESPNRPSVGRCSGCVAVGLVLYALWRLVSIVLPAENCAKAWAHPGRLRRQRPRVPRARLDRRVVRPPRRQLVRSGRARTPGSSGSHGTSWSGRLAAGWSASSASAHRRRRVLRRQGSAGVVPRRARTGRCRSGPP